MTITSPAAPRSGQAFPRRPLCPCVLGIAALLASALPCAGEDWPQLKHDALRSGNLPDRGVSTPLGLVAAVPLSDAVLTAPIVVGGKVLAIDAAGVLWCVEASSGRVLWKRETRGGADNTGNVSSPAAIGEYVHVGTMAGSHCVVRVEDGSLVWKSEPITRAIHVITVRDETLFAHAQYMESYLLDRATGKILARHRRGYRCTRFTVSEPYLLGANMDIYDLSRDFALVSTGPATDVLLCVGAQVSNGRMYFTTNGAGLQSCHVAGDEAEPFIAPGRSGPDATPERPAEAPDRAPGSAAPGKRDAPQ